MALSFDYENLNTPIEKNADLLRQRLEAVGLGATHDKTLHIIAHSMGGLVSRWMIEKIPNAPKVAHLFQLGTPNGGSEWSDVAELAEVFIPRLLNAGGIYVGIPPLVMKGVTWAFGKLFDAADNTLEQMNIAKSNFLKQLNDGSDPKVPLTIIAGNTSMLPEEVTLFKRLVNKNNIVRLILFKTEPNDLCVQTERILGIAGSEKRVFIPRKYAIACDHVSYYIDPAGTNALATAVYAVCGEE